MHGNGGKVEYGGIQCSAWNGGIVESWNTVLVHD